MARKVFVGVILASTLLVGIVIGLGIDPQVARKAMGHAVPSMSKENIAETDRHRREDFRQIDSLSDVLRLPVGFARTEALFALAGRSGVSQLGELMEEAETVRDVHFRRGAMGVLVLRLAELDPRFALEMVLSGKEANDYQLIRTIFSAWGRIDYEAAKGAIARIQNGDVRRFALRALVESGPDLTRERRQQLAQEFGLPVNSLLSFDRRSRVQHAAEGGYASAMDRAMKTTDSDQRGYTLAVTAHEWAKSNPEAALKYVTRIRDGRLRDGLLDNVFKEWARSDPETAFAAASKLPAGNAKKKSLTEVTTVWTRFDPEAAVAAIQTIENEQTRHVALAHMIGDWARQDPRAAMLHVESVANRTHRHTLANNLLVNMATQDPDLAIEWARTMDEGRSPELLGLVLASTARNEPERALDEALSVGKPAYREKLLHTVMPIVADGDSILAASFIDALPEKIDKSTLLPYVSNSWARSDPDAAFAWLMSKEQAIGRDALSELSNSIAEHNLEAAHRLLPQVPDTARHDWLNGIASQMAKSDAHRAATWIGQYKTDASYPDMARSVAVAMVYTDQNASIELVESITAEKPRQEAYVEVLKALAIGSPSIARELMRDADLSSDSVLQVEDYINSNRSR